MLLLLHETLDTCFKVQTAGFLKTTTLSYTSTMEIASMCRADSNACDFICIGMAQGARLG